MARLVAPGEAGVAGEAAGRPGRFALLARLVVLVVSIGRGLRAAGRAAGIGVARTGVGAARFSLRRCGRVRGSPPRTSEGRSSLMREQ